MTDTQTAFVLVPREPTPESEIGPVAWRGDAQDGARKFTAIQRVAEIWSEQRLAVHPLYPQARIDADAAEKATLLARAEAAEARVKELEAVLIDVRSAADSFRDENGDAVASQVISRADAALASKKETVDE